MLSRTQLLLTGVVVDTQDPENMGRVQVDISYGGEALTLPWLRMLQPAASPEHGFLFLPEKGDQVAILRGAGDNVDGMLILGALYNGDNLPFVPDPDGNNDTKQIRTRAGHELTFVDTDGSETITLTTGDGKVSIVLDQAGSSITIEGDQEVTITTSSAANVKANDVTVEAQNGIDIKGNAAVAIEGAGELSLKSSATIKFEGGIVQISGQMVQVQ